MRGWRRPRRYWPRRRFRTSYISGQEAKRYKPSEHCRLEIPSRFHGRPGFEKISFLESPPRLQRVPLVRCRELIRGLDDIYRIAVSCPARERRSYGATEKCLFPASPPTLAYDPASADACSAALSATLSALPLNSCTSTKSSAPTPHKGSATTLPPPANWAPSPTTLR